MLDILDAALHHSNGYAYFFKGDKYMKWEKGTGVKPLSDGRLLRDLGVDGWKGLPASFMSGVDAAFYYPSRKATYFFKGDKYVKWVEGTGPVALDGSYERRTGIDGWSTLPQSFRSGISAVIYHKENNRAYFFKGGSYVSYEPGVGVDGGVRELGVTGWKSLPEEFKKGVDAAMYYRSNGRIYFFKDRQYARWEPDQGLEARYPRVLGLRHGSAMSGGWPGLSHLLAGPLAGHTTPSATRVWAWLSDSDTASNLRIRLNGNLVTATVEDPVVSGMVSSMQSVHADSCIRIYHVEGLNRDASNQIDLYHGSRRLATVIVRTPPEPRQYGDVTFALTSCSNFSKEEQSAPVFQALAQEYADFTVMCGDNCYYVDTDGGTGDDSTDTPLDWQHTSRMFRRQMQARNHVEFVQHAARGAILSTWDDHDFGYNNAEGAYPFDEDGNKIQWEGRENASKVYRAMWPNKYRLDAPKNIRHRFRWGPVHVFMTDNRFDKNAPAGIIWGSDQTDKLIARMRASDAPLKVVVTSGQFLYKDGGEGHGSQAASERSLLLDAINGTSADKQPPISGRVLFLSGDVHYSSLMQANAADGGRVVELTSSPAKRVSDSAVPDEAEPGTRIWAERNDCYGVIRVSVFGVENGTVRGRVILEVRDSNGILLNDEATGTPCSSSWDLATGEVTW